MAQFVIKFWGPAGEQSRRVAADTADGAITLSGLQPSSVIEVKQDYFASLAALNQKKLSPVDQVLTLTSVAVQVGGGATFSEALMETVDYPSLGITKDEMGACTSAGEYLRLLRFDETVCLVVEAGEKAGSIATALKRAAKVLKDQIEEGKKLKGLLSSGYMMLGVGGAFLLGGPMLAGSTLHELIYVQKVAVDVNAMSVALMTLHNFYTNYWWVALAVLGGVFQFRKPIWDAIRRWPFFSIFNRRAIFKRGFDTVSSFRVLMDSRYTNTECLQFLSERSKGRTKELYLRGIEILSAGRGMAEAFADADWHIELARAFKGFESMGHAQREEVLEALVDAERTYYIAFSEKIGTIFSMGGKFVLIFALLMFFAGFYIPLSMISGE